MPRDTAFLNIDRTNTVKRVFAIVAFSLLLIYVAVRVLRLGHLEKVQILDGQAVPEVAQYKEEFATNLTIVAHWNSGEPLREPYFYLTNFYGPQPSPDGKFTLRQETLEDYYHRIVLLSTHTNASRTLVVVQESDPGSGTSYSCRWSSDSKAVFLFGSGTLSGYKHMRSFSLIFLTDRDELYAVDLGPHLAK